ncbi:polyamine-transporting ATPase 13A3-like isoform X2 [Watersipora subatra]|uniref:polyamine-transporting ATPase 13A3-like isoform X2 n=1 Tax=Watersipora subatra TaxID=2589382 RepID=UPI00355B5BA4
MAFPSLILNPATDEHLEGEGYKTGAATTFLWYLLAVLTVGISILLFYWKPVWCIRLLYTRCHVEVADIFILQDKYKQESVVKVVTKSVDSSLCSEYFYESSTDTKRTNAARDVINDISEDDDSDDRQALLSGDEDNVRGKVFRYIDHHSVRYIWNSKKRDYVRLHGLDVGVRCMSLHDKYTGVDDNTRKGLQLIYGVNEIDVEVKSYFILFIQEVLNPFYVFQIASIILWMSDNYYYYAATIMFISLLSIGVSLYETKKQSITLHEMVKTPREERTIFTQPDVRKTVTNYDLVPGDIIEVPVNGCMMLCDAVLLNGNCIVNEAMLTGESVPVTKTPLPHTRDEELFCPNEYKRHVLFCGTQVLQTRYYGNAKVKAVVVRTGFQTSKGELIRSIMFPKPMDFKFYQDAIRFILVLACVAVSGMCFTVYTMLAWQQPPGTVIKRVLDIVTIVVPPALPAALTVGMVYAQGRLKSAGIFCISPPRINLCGKLKLFCFDKTGTLTEDGLDLTGMVPFLGDGLHKVYDDARELPRGPFISAMATCHSLTRMDGVLSGDPLDLKMFEATGWTLDEPGEDTSRFDTLMPTVVRPPVGSEPPIEMFPGVKTPYEIGIVKQFTFSSSLQRMSVITRTLGRSHMELYTKGAPEKITSLCLPESIPKDFNEVLKKYTMQGYRVIALACKPLHDLAWHHAQRITRDQVEKELTFTGLLIMQNSLKPETTPIIKELRVANIRTVMVTGDNILTAVSVARECGIISKSQRVIQVLAHPPTETQSARIEWLSHDTAESESEATDEELHFSRGSYQMMINAQKEDFCLTVDGKSFAVLMTYFMPLMPRICLKGAVFARMGPEQKAQLIEQLQSLGYGVGMCGDGANDCSALKAAHAGISLSEAEASVASPFTSKIPNIGCVPTLIREGRAALTTSFGCFKYMALYSLIQFVSVLLLYYGGTNLGDTQFLYIDLAITTTVAFLMGHTHAYHKLVPQRPSGALLSFAPMFTLFAQIILMATVQIIAYVYLHQQYWFTPNESTPGGDFATLTYESTVVFVVSSFLYITLAVNYSVGPPYRKRIWTNKPFFISAIVLWLLSLMLLFYPPEFVEKFLGMKHIDIKHYGFKIILLLFVVIHFLASTMIESFLVDSELFQRFSRCIRRKRRPNNKYKRVAMELVTSTWPPVGEVTYPIPE